MHITKVMQLITNTDKLVANERKKQEQEVKQKKKQELLASKERKKQELLTVNEKKKQEQELKEKKKQELLAAKQKKKQEILAKKEEKQQGKNDKIITKGTGAGGKNTNKNGLPFEESTSLESEYEYEILHEPNQSAIIYFKNYINIPFIATKKLELFKYMDTHIDKNQKNAHGCKSPDECFIDESKKRIFIIEKKMQQVAGSVCEKIQSSDFKLWQYNRLFPHHTIVYIYCLSEWFKINCLAEIEYFIEKQVPHFWGDSKTYKKELIDFIVNYK
jgi:hypothetical protein